MTLECSSDTRTDPERKQLDEKAAQDAILTVKSSESGTAAYFDARANSQSELERGGVAAQTERTSPSTIAEDDTAPQHHQQNRILSEYSQGGLISRGLELARGAPHASTYSNESTMTLNPKEVADLDELRILLPTIRSWQTAQSRSSAAVCGDPPPIQPSSTGVSPRTRASTAGFSIAALDDDGISDCSSDDLDPSNDDYVRLSRDIYSILFVTNPRKHAFLFAFVVFAFQIFVLALVMVDVIDLQDRNELNIPAGVSTAVRAAQFIAILVSVATQDDLITSINWLHNGYPRGAVHLDNGGQFWQWVLAVALRFVQGGLCLAVTFILIMQSSEVVALFLDFLALTFISTIDDIMFALARDGYFSHKLKKETKYVMSVRIPVPVQRYFRPLIFALVSFFLVVGWVFIVFRQSTGYYIDCKTVSVQFGDAFTPELAHFSGIYEVSSSYLGRPIYTEKRPHVEAERHGQAMFGYCDYENAWTFSYASVDGGAIDPCNWYAKTTETLSYDLSSIPSSEWHVLSKESVEVPFLHFSLTCNDCEYQTKDTCSNAGQCLANRCVCDKGRFGLNCEYKSPCSSIEIDSSKQPFEGDWAEKYDMLRYVGHRSDEYKVHTVTVYGRPVYTKLHDGGSYHIIMFTGRRWVVIDSDSIPDMRRGLDTDWEGLVNWLTSFHGYWSTYIVSYISSPTDVFTPTDAVSPVGLQWYATRPINNEVDLNSPQNSVLLCGVCDNVTNPCGNGGVCLKSGECNCQYGTFGTLCQVAGFQLCNSLSVQFGDALVSAMGGFSGSYDLTSDTINGRSVYVERSRGSAAFAYCEREKAWTFSLSQSHSQNSTASFDPCADWKARSPISETYDITNAAIARDWLIRRSNDVDEGVQLKFFKLTCNDCDRKKQTLPLTPRSGKSQGCRYYGLCVEEEAPIGSTYSASTGKRCKCDEDRYGLSCEFRLPCDELRADVPAQYAGKFPRDYTLLQSGDGAGVTVNDRPVYVNEVSPGSYLIVLFTGVRWITTRSNSHPPLSNRTSISGLSAYLSNAFHGFHSEYAVNFISEPADIETLVKTATPVGLAWFEPKAFDDRQADTSLPVNTALFTCAYCDGVDYPCYNGGLCNEGQCECQKGTFGRTCQIQAICQSLSVTFGEKLGENQVVLGEFNNDFFLSSVTRSYRPVYASQNGMLAYCEEEDAWTFTLWAQNKKKSPELQDPCTRWTAVSVPTNTFDVMTLTSWFIRGGDGTQIPLSYLTFGCNYNRAGTPGYSSTSVLVDDGV